jgi:hypothetical protein
MPHGTVVDHKRLPQRALAQPIEFLDAEALRRLNESQGSWLKREWARELEQPWLAIVFQLGSARREIRQTVEWKGRG